MKQNNLMKASFAALLLASSMAVSAQSQEDFKPQVIYQDADYIASHKHSPLASVPASSSAQQSSSRQDVAAAPSEKAAGQSADQMGQNYWLVLVVVGLGGLIFWSSKRSGAAEAVYVAPAAHSGSSEPTGVGRYLKAHGDSTDVPANALTGVGRYLKEHEGSTSVAAAALTGVARYMQNRG